MKLLTDINMSAIGTITASSSAAGFPATNLLQYDPNLVWQADAFSAAISLVLDFNVAADLDHIWLNNANFIEATIQANSANSWASPAVSRSVTLASDNANVYKGFFELSSTKYRYARIVIPVQGLLFGDTLPCLGNVIVGKAVDVRFDTWSPDVNEETERFKSDGGSLSLNRRGTPQHIFSATITGTKEEVETTAALVRNWNLGVIYTELRGVGDSYLVYGPTGIKGRDRSPIDCDREATFEERT